MFDSETIGKILSSAIPREFLLSFVEYAANGSARAMAAGADANPGHRAGVVGHNRHFNIQEALYAAFKDYGISCGLLRSNCVLVGQLSKVRLARVHMNNSRWDNSRRSKAKLELCEHNRVLREAMQRDFFLGPPSEPTQVTAFLVTQGNATDGSSMFLVVPDDAMDLRNPIFTESIPLFVQRYATTVSQTDTAKPTLKKGVKHISEDGEEKK